MNFQSTVKQKVFRYAETAMWVTSYVNTDSSAWREGQRWSVEEGLSLKQGFLRQCGDGLRSEPGTIAWGLTGDRRYRLAALGGDASCCVP